MKNTTNITGEQINGGSTGAFIRETTCPGIFDSI